MLAAILRLGGTPREWVTDNMSALVTLSGGRRLKVQRVYEFAKAAGFELKPCRPRSPQTKGKVESSNRFLSRLMAYQGDFDGWDDIDGIIARIEDRSNSEPNETTGLPPSALFMEEKDALLPVGNVRALEEALGDVVRIGKVPATMLVSAHGEAMSAPRRCIGKPARVVCMPGGAMDCYVGGELVYFADCSRLVEDLKHASAKGALARRMRFYEHCSLLIVDELGYLDIGKEGADLLFQLVNRRYALKRPTIVTTNVPVGRRRDVLGSNVTASAVADRPCHHCAMTKITGRSYRLKDVSLGDDEGKEERA